MSSLPTISDEKMLAETVNLKSATPDIDEKPPNSPSEDSTGFEINTKAEDALVWKIDIHLMPILFVLYMFAFLDRVNIGNARIQGLMKDLNMSGTQYNVASMILFVPYILLEVPSNIIIKRVPPSAWLSGLMFFWGLVSMCQGFVASYGGLITCRVLLGVFEAGVFPGAAYLIGMYYKRFELQKRLVLFFSSSMLSGAFGGLLAYALAKLAGKGGYNGWRWIFIIEGLATSVVAIVAYFFIVDWPEDAKFLTEEERELIKHRLANDGNSGACRMDTLNKDSTKRIFRDWKIWCGTFMYMMVTTTGYATSFFIPTILTEFGWTASSAQLHTIPIYVVGVFLTMFCAWWSDRIQHRYAFTIGGLSLAVLGYIILLCQGRKTDPHHLSSGVKYLALFFITSGNYICQPLLVVWLANNMAGHYKRSFAAALQIGIGNVGGIIGSNIFLTDEKPLYRTGYGTGMAMLLFGMVLSTIFYFGMKWENKQRDAGKRDHRLTLPQEVLCNLGDDHPTFRFNG
jgi:sugar phosphate permease